MKGKTIAIIPARAGSKGIKHKNKILLHGKPLIRWTIDAALQAKCLDSIVVTTDDGDIASLSQGLGIIVVKRPASLATDRSPTIDAVRHAVSRYVEAKKIEPICIVILQPTSPLRLAEDIDAAIELFFKNDCMPVCSVVEYDGIHPSKMYIAADDGKMYSAFTGSQSGRRQDQNKILRRNGAIYVVGQKELKEKKVFRDEMVSYLMPESQSIDIDSVDDLLRAECYLKSL